jgi:Na+/H+ antiporter
MQRKGDFWIAIFPLVFLISLIAMTVPLFGDEITAGPAQIALLSTAVVTTLIAMLYKKVSWEHIENCMLGQLSKTGSAIFILLMIGALTGTWMQSGVVPTMIYYGLKIIHPSIFLVIAFILSAVISIMSGSSWTTIGTFGVAMLSAGQILGIPAPWLAGAIISGAYLGDKASPLSDTVNLCTSVTGVNLYLHVRYQLLTTIPAAILSIIFFGVAGFVMTTSSAFDIHTQTEALKSTFWISPWLLLVPAFTIVLIVKKVSPFITLFLSALVGAVVAIIAQPELCRQMVAHVHSGLALSEVPSWKVAWEAGLRMISGSVNVETGNEMLNTLTATNGMAGMLNTVWLILCVVTFGGAMEAGGMIQSITQQMTKYMRNAFGLVAGTTGTCIFFNLTLSDQYMSVLLPGKMFAEAYEKQGYRPELLSRALGDSGTVTSVLVPWNTCGVVQSSVLHVATLSYLPYCFFNLIIPVISIFIAAIGYKIKRDAPKTGEASR